MSQEISPAHAEGSFLRATGAGLGRLGCAEVIPTWQRPEGWPVRPRGPQVQRASREACTAQQCWLRNRVGMAQFSHCYDGW